MRVLDDPESNIVLIEDPTVAMVRQLYDGMAPKIEQEYPRGSFIWNRTRRSKGTVIGGYTHCRMEGCGGRRIWVRWPDGTVTKPCTKGLVELDGKTYIGG